MRMNVPGPPPPPISFDAKAPGAPYIKLPQGVFAEILSQPPNAAAQPSTQLCTDTSADDENSAQSAVGTASIAVWKTVVTLDNQSPVLSQDVLCAARSVAKDITDSVDVTAAKTAIANSKTTAKTNTRWAGDENKATLEAVEIVIEELLDSIPDHGCTVTEANGNIQASYTYPHWLFPLFHKDCQSDDQIQHFFDVNRKVSEGNGIQYLYNAQQSSSAITGDLVTSTFWPGFQAILAGSTTTGNGTTNSSSTTTTSSSGATSRLSPSDASSTSTDATSTTDSVQTAVSKLENGGDFNVRFPLPVLFHSAGSASVSGLFSPNLGFNLNGIGSQSTITEATEYTFNTPLEFYAQLGSVGSGTKSTNTITPATFFVDVKPAGEFISSVLAQKLGPSVPRAFFLGQASVGIEFAQSFRVSLQYVYGNAQIYQSASSTTSTSASTTPTSRIGGFHLAVSFSPQKSTSSSN